MKTKQNNKTQDENLFYKLNTMITEDIATQKVVMLANSTIDIAEEISQDFKVIIGYRALNKLLFSDSINKAKKLNGVKNGFEWVSQKSVEDIAYCLKHEPAFIENPQLYFSLLDLDEEFLEENIDLNDMPFLTTDLREATDPKDFLGMFRGEFNLIDLIGKNFDFADDLIYQDLINLYFKFDVKYDKDEEMTNKSTMKVVFQLANETFLTTYTWSFNLKSFLNGQSEPKLTTSFALIDVLVENSCI